jgi:hypothetical protein
MGFIIGAVKPHHAHRFFAETTVSKNHYHIVEGFTRVVNGNSYDRHYHLYRGVTSFENKHYHRFFGKTGPAITLPDGSHYHLIEERTYYNYDEALKIKFGGVKYGDPDRPKHDHRFKGKTMESVGYEPFFNDMF